MINPNNVEEILNNYEAELNLRHQIRVQSKRRLIGKVVTAREAVVEIRKRFRALVSGDGVPARTDDKSKATD